MNQYCQSYLSDYWQKVYKDRIPYAGGQHIKAATGV